VPCHRSQRRAPEADGPCAEKLAGDKDVGFAGPHIIRQAINPLLRPLGLGPVKLERTRVMEGDGVTHLYLNVLRRPDH
jgi:hypothetical protein